MLKIQFGHSVIKPKPKFGRNIHFKLVDFRPLLKQHSIKTIQQRRLLEKFLTISFPASEEIPLLDKFIDANRISIHQLFIYLFIS